MRKKKEITKEKILKLLEPISAHFVDELDIAKESIVSGNEYRVKEALRKLQEKIENSKVEDFKGGEYLFIPWKTDLMCKALVLRACLTNKPSDWRKIYEGYQNLADTLMSQRGTCILAYEHALELSEFVKSNF